VIGWVSTEPRKVCIKKIPIPVGTKNGPLPLGFVPKESSEQNECNEFCDRTDAARHLS